MPAENRYDPQRPIWEFTTSEAQDLLLVFLKVGDEGLLDLAGGSVDLNYTEDSVVAILTKSVRDLECGALNEEQKNVRFGRMGYYFGEALIRNKPGLHWGIGNPMYAFANQPVVTGFAAGLQAATITICRNLVGAVVEKTSPPARIEKGVRHWFGLNVADR